MIININEVCVLFKHIINYFIVSIYKVFILYLLYIILYDAQSQINLLIRKLMVPCPLTPSIYYTGGF